MLEVFKKMCMNGFSIYSDFVLFEGDEDTFFDCVILKEHNEKTIEVVVVIGLPSARFNLQELTIYDLINNVSETDIIEIYYVKEDVASIDEIAGVSFVESINKWVELVEQK